MKVVHCHHHHHHQHHHRHQSGASSYSTVLCGNHVNISVILHFLSFFLSSFFRCKAGEEVCKTTLPLSLLLSVHPTDCRRLNEALAWAYPRPTVKSTLPYLPLTYPPLSYPVPLVVERVERVERMEATANLVWLFSRLLYPPQSSTASCQ